MSGLATSTTSSEPYPARKLQRMNVRSATPNDLDVLADLHRAFSAELPPPLYSDEAEEEHRRQVIERFVSERVALLAEDNGDAQGFLLGYMKGSRLGFVSDLYVIPPARRSGVAAALVREAVRALRGHGAESVAIEVGLENEDARSVYERWGFRETRVWLEVTSADLEERLSREAPEPSYGLVFAQTDDESRVAKAVAQYVPRLGRSGRTDVHPPTNGWIAVDDELCSGDPTLLRRLAQELSYRTGGVVLALGVEEGAVLRYVLFDRGSVADEYCSLPEYHGPLPPGDVVAMSANPTVAQRLTGADPERIRAVARTGSASTELPPAGELYRELAEVLGAPLP